MPEMGSLAETQETGAPTSPSSRATEVQAALQGALAAAAADERVGPLIAATKLRMRFEFTDSGVVLNLAAGEGDGGLRWWSSEDAGWRPQFSLAMGSEVANSYLLGRQSLAIAIARGQARVSSDAGAALRCLPATRLISGPYRRVVQSRFPTLAA